MAGFVIRFFYAAHQHGMTSSVLGSYHEVDTLLSPAGATQKMRDYHSVLMIVPLDVDAAWLALQSYSHLTEYDGTNLYIHTERYNEAYNTLNKIVDGMQKRRETLAKLGDTPPAYPGAKESHSDAD